MRDAFSVYKLCHKKLLFRPLCDPFLTALGNLWKVLWGQTSNTIVRLLVLPVIFGMISISRGRRRQTNKRPKAVTIVDPGNLLYSNHKATDTLNWSTNPESLSGSFLDDECFWLGYLLMERTHHQKRSKTEAAESDTQTNCLANVRCQENATGNIYKLFDCLRRTNRTSSAPSFARSITTTRDGCKL